jgi:hypothetical protein
LIFYLLFIYLGMRISSKITRPRSWKMLVTGLTTVTSLTRTPFQRNWAAMSKTANQRRRARRRAR